MLRTLPATAQQKLAEAMAGTQLVSFRGLPGTQQISESFVGGVRNPHGGQVTRTLAACQLQGVAPISFHTVTGLHGNQRRCDHFAAHAESGELPIPRIPCGSGFVADPQLLDRTELVHQLPNRLGAVSNYTEGSDFTAGLGNGDCDGVHMDIETDSPFFACGSVLLAQRNPRICETGGRSFYFESSMDRPGSHPLGHDD